MTKSLLFTILLLLAFQSTPGQNKIYCWSDVDPGWRSQSLDYWENVNGYGKSIPGEMMDLIRSYHAEINGELRLALEGRMVDAGLQGEHESTSNPVSLNLGDHDLYLDLQCKINEVSKEYPFFSQGNLNVSPSITYMFSIYDSRGEVVGSGQYVDYVNYRKNIRPLLKDMSNYRRDIEIYKLTFGESFRGAYTDSIVTEARKLVRQAETTSITSDPVVFNKVVGLLFEKRKVRYPESYGQVQTNSQAAVNVSASGNYNPPATEVMDGGNTPVDPRVESALLKLIEGSRNYALLIGVDDYMDPNVPDLANPISDTRKLYRTLTENYTFNKEDVIFLENPTRNVIIQAFDYLSGVVEPQDNLLVFYAGHGLWDEQLEKGFWIPADASKSNRANWFSNSALRDYIGGIKSHHTLLITDACFGGGIFKTREFSGVTPATVELYRLPSRKAMTSGAMSAVPDKSVFIEYLVKRLDENNMPFLSSEQLFASFKIAVINNSANNQVPQFGEIRETGDEGGDYLFIRKRNQ